MRCTCPDDWQGMDHTAGCKARGGLALAEGCCSAYPDAFGVPCSHQRRDPTTICDTCKAAAKTR